MEVVGEKSYKSTSIRYPTRAGTQRSLTVVSVDDVDTAAATRETPAPPPQKVEDAKEPTVMVIRIVDANALALMAFGFSTFMFAAFLCNWTDSGLTGFAYLTDMLTWGVAICLCTAGLIQGLNDDLLGFSSYLFHAALLGTIGHNFHEVLIDPTFAGSNIIAWFCYVAVWVNLVFAVMAFRIAYMFGILYLTVANMFLFVGLNFHGVFPTDSDPTVGGKVAGSMCCIVAAQCFYLLLPVLTGRGFLK